MQKPIQRGGRHDGVVGENLAPIIKCLVAGQRDAPVALVALTDHLKREVRQQQSRDELFAELRRVVRPGGLIVLVEHMRDPWNFLAFGPGCWHFFPRREWQRLAEVSGLRIRAEGRKTRFVRYFILER